MDLPQRATRDHLTRTAERDAIVAGIQSGGDVRLPDESLQETHTDTYPDPSPFPVTVVDFTPPATGLGLARHRVSLHLRDMDVSLDAVSVSVSADQVGMILVPGARVDRLKLKTRLKLEVDEVLYDVMYLGGSLTFELPNCKLHVLSFIRLTV